MRLKPRLVIAGAFVVVTLGEAVLVSCGGLVERAEPSASLDHVPIGTDAHATAPAPPDENREQDAAARTIVRIAASETAMCGVREDGRVVCWGINAVLLATGLEDGGYGFGPAIVPGLTTVRDVALAKAPRYGYDGPPFVCAVKMDGMVLCWGANDASEHSLPRLSACVGSLTGGHGVVFEMV